jgi:hypothetical protein
MAEPGQDGTGGDRPVTGMGRRQFLKVAGLSGAALVGTSIAGKARAGAATVSGPSLLRRPDISDAPVADQLHLTFGADPTTEMVASWSTPVPVRRPRLRLGTPDGGFGQMVDVEEKAYTEGITGETVVTYHASMRHLRPDTRYVYEVLADGAPPTGGSFKTAPQGRSKIRFTSFGDQAIPAAVGTGIGPWTTNAGAVVPFVEEANPLFHLLNGDLCYANLSDDPVGTWRSFFHTNMRSARNRPWMPAAGNHENEVGNGPQGYLPYQTWFTLPDNDEPDEFAGNWYSFKVGSVGVVSINNDDVCYQQGSFSPYRLAHLIDPGADRDDYIRGYSDGAQKRWLQRTLAELRGDADIDWIVVCMHQVAMSSANFNGADLGIREEWMPLFDSYGVDLVVAGHEHHYERTYPVRGVDHTNMSPTGKDLLTPLASEAGALAEFDTTKGTVHMILGGGGHSSATPPASFDPANAGVVIYDVEAPVSGFRSPDKVLLEPSDWSAHRDLTYEYGFGVFDVDPGRPGGTTSITFTYYGTTRDHADYLPRDGITLIRPRADR